jgi:hypothetical protein
MRLSALSHIRLGYGIAGRQWDVPLGSRYGCLALSRG